MKLKNIKFKRFFHGNTKLLLSFELGIMLAKVAQENNIELTKEIVERAEKIILNEFQTRSPQQIASSMELLALAIFEVN